MNRRERANVREELTLTACAAFVAGFFFAAACLNWS